MECLGWELESEFNDLLDGREWNQSCFAGEGGTPGGQFSGRNSVELVLPSSFDEKKHVS